MRAAEADAADQVPPDSRDFFRLPLFFSSASLPNEENASATTSPLLELDDG